MAMFIYQPVVCFYSELSYFLSCLCFIFFLSCFCFLLCFFGFFLWSEFFGLVGFWWWGLLVGQEGLTHCCFWIRMTNISIKVNFTYHFKTVIISAVNTRYDGETTRNTAVRSKALIRHYPQFQLIGEWKNKRGHVSL